VAIGSPHDRVLIDRYSPARPVGDVREEPGLKSSEEVMEILIPPCPARHPAEERITRTPADPGQDRAVPPDPATLAGRPATRPFAGPRAQQHYRLRYDRLDAKGKMTLRRAGRMHHLHAGVKHARKRVLALADDHQVTVTDLATGEVLSTHQIQPDHSYWPNQNNKPDRWPGSSS
jgi:hypothetical protein